MAIFVKSRLVVSCRAILPLLQCPMKAPQGPGASSQQKLNCWPKGICYAVEHVVGDDPSKTASQEAGRCWTVHEESDLYDLQCGA